jgi:hypothetical protein
MAIISYACPISTLASGQGMHAQAGDQQSFMNPMDRESIFMNKQVYDSGFCGRISV